MTCAAVPITFCYVLGQPELSIVVPVFNAAATIESLVTRIGEVFGGRMIEVVLVNDGSADETERVCAQLAAQIPGVLLVQLSRNFGEHNAVLAGLAHSSGEYVAVIDDDGQNPPEEVARLLDELKAKRLDVVYGRYAEKKHSALRNLGSRMNDRMATRMLHKPPELYLSSFKVMTRFVVDQIVKYRGPYPYIDGLIYRTTRNIGQLTVEHRGSALPQSRYTTRRLISLWLNMFLNFSIQPLRISVYIGLTIAVLSVGSLIFIAIDRIWITPELPLGIPTVLGAVVFLAGVQLMLLGIVGEYLGRLYLDHTGAPQYIVRYVKSAGN